MVSEAKTGDPRRNVRQSPGTTKCLGGTDDRGTFKLISRRYHHFMMFPSNLPWTGLMPKTIFALKHERCP